MRVLFQGDSITDGNRYKDPSQFWDKNHTIGHSYAFTVCSQLGCEYWDRGIEFVNRGVSGECLENLLNRFDEDFAKVDADVVSILIGVNDAAHGVTPEQYEQRYRELLDRLLALKSETRFILIEPFMLPVGIYTDRVKYARNFELVEAYRSIVQELAVVYNAVFIPLQSKFDEMAAKSGAPYWCWDGIHPTYNGHGLIAREWLKGAQALITGEAYHDR